MCEKGERIKYSIIFLSVILTVQLIIMIMAGKNKSGFFVDELWSYGLANSYYSPHIYSGDLYIANTYLHEEFFRDYLEVTSDDAFQYDSVFYNLSNDAHPPLYFCVLHTMSSIFQNRFSKWFGIAPNIVFFLFGEIFLFLIGRKLFQNDYIALVPVVIWGCTTQTVSYVILVRMYMLLSMFGLVDTCLHAEYLRNRTAWTRKRLIILLLVNWLGFLTQYYYYMYAFLFSGFTVVIMVLRRDWKQLWHYVYMMFLAVAVAMLSFPAVLHIADEKGSWGEQAAGKLLSFGGFVEPIRLFWSNAKEKMFYGINSYYPLVVLLFLFLTVILWLVRNRKESFRGKLFAIDAYALVISIVSVCFFIIVSKLSPFIADRYYVMISPYIWLIGAYFVFYVCKPHRWLLVFGNIGLLAMGVVTFILGVRDGKVMYQYPRQAYAEEVLAPYKGVSCVYIVGNGREYTVVNYALQLEKFSEVLLMDTDRKPMFEYEIHDEGDVMIVYGDGFQNQEQLVQEVLANTRYTQVDFLTRGTGVYWEDTDEQYIYRFY